MSVRVLYSKRQKVSQEGSDVYVYDFVDYNLKIQLIYVCSDLFDYCNRRRFDVINVYAEVVGRLRREYGVFGLINKPFKGRDRFRDEFNSFLLSDLGVGEFLDSIELFFDVIFRMCTRGRQPLLNGFGVLDEKRFLDCVGLINLRFKEANFGYRYEDGAVVRVDSEFVHTEVVNPALRLMSDGGYSGALQEFRQAHDHFVHARMEDVLVSCCKSLESVLKTICSKRSWAVDPNASAKKLIETCFKNELVPRFWENHFNLLQNLLVAGVPAARNKLGGHGQGAEVRDVPEDLVAYVLHMTASTIVFLVKAERALE